MDEQVFRGPYILSFWKFFIQVNFKWRIKAPTSCFNIIIQVSFTVSIQLAQKIHSQAQKKKVIHEDPGPSLTE